jgi:hypothetical protein
MVKAGNIAMPHGHFFCLVHSSAGYQQTSAPSQTSVLQNAILFSDEQRTLLFQGGSCVCY